MNLTGVKGLLISSVARVVEGFVRRQGEMDAFLLCLRCCIMEYIDK